MKKIEFLIRDVRRRTNNLDPKAITNLEVCSYFNDVQMQVVHFLTRSGSNVGFMNTSLLIPINVGQTEYPLPSTLQLGTSIDAVFVLENGKRSYELPQKNISDLSYGYAISGGNLIIGSTPSFREIEVVYNRRVRPLSPTIATVDSLLAGNLIKVEVLEEKFWLEDEFITIKDKTYGIMEYDTATQELLLDRPHTDITLGNKILIGTDSTREMSVPEEALPFILRQVEVYLNHRRNSTKINASLQITAEEFQNLADMIAKPGTGVNYPVILDDGYMV